MMKPPWLCYPVLLVCATVLSAHEIDLPASLIEPGQTLELVKDGLGMTEGPACDRQANLYFTEPFEGNIWKISPQGEASVFVSGTDTANGLVFDAEDRLLACERPKIVRYDESGTPTVVVEHPDVGQANDLTLLPDGAMFFTSPVWGGTGDILYVSPEKELKKVVSSVTGFPNGIEYMQERNELYVAFTQQNKIVRYAVDAEMNVGSPADFAAVSAPDGFALDENGDFWVAANTAKKVVVFDSTGNELGSITVSGQNGIQNCAFGGPENRTLYIAGNPGVFRIRLRVAGRNTRGETGTNRRPAQNPLSPRGAAPIPRLHRSIEKRTGRHALSYRTNLLGALLPRLEAPLSSSIWAVLPPRRPERSEPNAWSALMR